MDTATTPLLILGSPDAAACEGEWCAIPELSGQAIVNQRLDSDLV